MKQLMVCLALMLGLAACDGDAGATSEPTKTFTPTATGIDTPSSSETSSPSGPVEPTLPAAAKKATTAGAEAFVRYYWELVNYTQHSGETATLQDLNLQTCAPCNAGWKWVRKVYGHGGTIKGGTLTVRELKVVPSGGGWVATLRLETTRQVIEGAGNLNGTYGTQGNDVAMVVRHYPGTWQTTSLTVQ